MVIGGDGSNQQKATNKWEGTQNSDWSEQQHNHNNNNHNHNHNHNNQPPTTNNHKPQQHHLGLRVSINQVGS